MPVYRFKTPTLCLVTAIALLGCQSASQTTEAAQCTTTVTETTEDAPTSDTETKPGAVVAPEDSTGDITEEGDDGSTVEVVAPTTTLRDLGAFSSGFFSDRTDCLTTNPSTRRYGISVTDIDLDGDFEAVVAGYGGANEVWDFQDESVVNATPPSLADPDRRAIGVASCDVNGDGREEVYFLNIDQFGGLGEVSDRLYQRNEGGWSDLFEAATNTGVINQFSGRSVACLDRDGDGRYGVFVANYGGPMKLFEMTDAGALRDVGESAGIALTTGGRALLALPVGDGPMDMFAGNENGANFLFQNQGDGTFEERAATFGITDASQTVRGATTLDADGDGDFDLVYGNWRGPHRLWLRDGDAFTLATPSEMESPSKIRTVIAADFDNDGYEEIFWNNIGEPNRLFKQTPDGWESIDMGDALEPDGLGTGAAVLDLDGDGLLELFISHGESGSQPLSLYVTAPNENHFLRVIPLTQQGGPARGAVVELQGETRTQRRLIDAGSGYLCQMEPVAHFGLGQDAALPSLTITWPDGTTWRGQAPAVDGNLTVSYEGVSIFKPLR